MTLYKIDDVAARIAASNNLTLEEARKRVTEVFEEVKTMAKEHTVEIKAFGKFFPYHTTPRVIYAQGKPYTSRASHTIKFKASPGVKRFEKRAHEEEAE